MSDNDLARIKDLEGRFTALELELEGKSAEVAALNRCLAAAERRQAQTIEAVSAEIARISKTVNSRLDALEAGGRPSPHGSPRQPDKPAQGS